MRVLLTGAGGQLALELERAKPTTVDLVPLGAKELDITRLDDVVAAIADVAPQAIVNAAAYTVVDRAEDEEPAAHAVNAEGVAHLARGAVEVGARLIHISTDFVFNGRSQRPYLPTDPTHPLSAYGRTKLAGERLALEICGAQACVVRTSWLYSSRGKNFVSNMLRLMAARDDLAVVADQVGSPTWAALLARALWRLVARTDLAGVWHWSDGGECSRFELAQAIRAEGLTRGLLDQPAALRPVTTAEFSTRAVRPAFSVLDSSATCKALDLEEVPWRRSLGRMLDDMKEADTLDG